MMKNARLAFCFHEYNSVKIFTVLTGFLAIGFFLAGSALFSNADEEPDQRPNLVLIIADDMAWDDCGVCGHPNIKTPNIDKLARDGMMFHQAFLTTSSCSPSRASIITGTYPHQTDAEQLHWELPADKVTFVEKLKEAGYWTAQAGKWHMGDHIKGRFDFLAEDNTDALRESVGELPQADGSGSHLWVPLLQHRPENQPFFLWLAAVDPHRGYQEGTIDEPHTPEDVILPPYVPDTEKVRKDFAMYYDEISRLDEYTGRVVEELERQGVLDNTVILFISDNGRPFPRDKTTLHDSGIKTPWIISWPDAITPGTETESLVSVVDIAPTFLALSGLEAGDEFVGRDFSPILSDPSMTIRSHIYGQAHWHDHENFVRSIRDERYNYIRNFFNDLPATPPADALTSPTFAEIRRLEQSGELDAYQRSLYFEPRPEEELYDVINDPHELNNLAEDPEYQQVLNRMRAGLLQFMETHNDGVPRLRTPDEFHRVTGEPLPNNHRPRTPKKEMFGGCNCIYLPPAKFFE
ncbi:MAG: sulfatase [Balneolaceae bacterium]|nr:sulfatase [Balneolaceae bacterium]